MMAAGGVICGALLAAVVTRALSALLVGVSALDPATLVTSAALLAAVAVGASWLPARGAARTDPMVAIRQS
jgi:ABC-type antimicrobial peptide transport system permease subunit